MKTTTFTTTTTTTIIIIIIIILRRWKLEFWRHECSLDLLPKSQSQNVILKNNNNKTDHQIPARRPNLIIINNKKKKRICKIVDFAVPADHRINLKESEKKDKYLDLARELKKLWNMKVTIVPIVIGALPTITKGLLKGLKDLEVADGLRRSKREHC